MWSLRGVNMQQETGITQNVIDHYMMWTCNKKRELLRMWSLAGVNMQQETGIIQNFIDH